MVDSFTPNKALILQQQGTNNGTWGTENNTNYSIIDLNLGGRISIDVSGSSNVTVTSTQARNVWHNIIGTLTGSIEYILPDNGSFYFLNNQTSGAFTVTAIANGGTGIIVPQGSTMMVFVNEDTDALVRAFTSNVIVDEQTYTTAGTPTWSRPAGLGTNAMTFVQVWGAGGSGGAGVYSGGGGAGSYKEAWFLTSSLSSSETVTIGAGGAVQNGTNANGNNGGSSSFGSHIAAYGGAHGTGSATSALGGAGGSWFSNSTGQANDVPTAEGNGGTGSTAPTTGYYVGGGGGQASNTPSHAAGAASVFGGGGGGCGGSSATLGAGGTSTYGGAGGAGTTSGAASAGTQPGGGGGGSPSGSNSGKGGDGKVIVTTYNG